MFNPKKPNTTMTDKAKVLKPDPRAFANDYGTYRIKGDEKRTKYILIDSWRDALIHKTIWRMMDAAGNVVRVPNTDVVPYKSKD